MTEKGAARWGNPVTMTHNLGFPQIGAKRELKQAVESYWNGDITLAVCWKKRAR